MTLQNEKGEKKDITFTLLDNSVCNKLKTLLNDINNMDNVWTDYTNICVYKDPEQQKVDKYEELMENIKMFDDNNNNGYKFENTFTLQEMSIESLNLLHSQFEEYLTEFGSGMESNQTNLEKNKKLGNYYDWKIIDSSLNRINNLIHFLEDVIAPRDEGSSSNGFFSTALKSDPNLKNIKFDDHEYDTFTLNHEWGDLFLGYGTTGKSLFHIFKDNDLALLERGFKVSPQEYVTSNIMCLFGDNPNNYHDNFVKWFNDNKVEERFGISWSKYNSSGYIKIGKLDFENMSVVIDTLLEYNHITAYNIL